MPEFIKYYQQATDFKQRERDGLDPLKSYLKEIEDLSDLKDLAGKAVDWGKKGGSALPFTLEISSKL